MTDTSQVLNSECVPISGAGSREKHPLALRIKKTRPQLSDKTLTAYLYSIRKLRDHMRPKLAGRAIDSVSFLKDFKDAEEFIDGQQYITSKKNLLTSAIVSAKASDMPESVVSKYSEKLRSLSNSYNGFLAEQKKTTKQEANWLDYKQLTKLIAGMRSQIKDRGLFAMNLADLNQVDYKLLQIYVFLSLFVEYPYRNDYAEMLYLTPTEYDRMTDANRK